MPVISRFYGIAIRMHYKDHQPPHFHAWYGDDSALVEIASGRVIGSLPKRALDLVQEWRAARQRELLSNWGRAQAHEALLLIAPLE